MRRDIKGGIVRVSSSAFMLTRRSLLAALGAGMIADSAAGTAPGPRSGLSRPPRQMSRAGLDDWTALIGERFGAGPGTSLRLVAVEPAGERASAPHRRPFTAVFEAAGAAAPEGDRTYRLSHPAIASLPLFIGPAASVESRTRFVAEFG